MTYPVSIRVNNILLDLYSSVICHWNHQLKPYLLPLRKYRVNQSHNLPPLSLLGLRDVFICIRQSYFVSKSVILCQLVIQTLSVSHLDFVCQSIRFCQLVSQTLSVGQSYFVSYSVRLSQLFSQTFLVIQSDLVSQSVILCHFQSIILCQLFQDIF